MMDELRTPFFQRATALLAGPWLLGQQALASVLSADRHGPPSESSEPGPLPLTLTPPEHAIKRRG